MGAITQIQVLEGKTGLATCMAVLSKYIHHSLTLDILPQQVTSVLQSVSSISDLDVATEKAVRRVFAERYNQQMRIMTYFSAVVFLVSLLTWERQSRRMERTVSEKSYTEFLVCEEYRG